jgi:hypothetical protein
MDLATAKRVASTLEWASSTNEWGSCICQIAVEGDRLERYPWFTDKANFGAFAVHVPGRQSLELVLSDQYERGDFYLAVYLKNRTAGTFAELRHLGRESSRPTREWTYAPRKRGDNEARKELCQHLTGSWRFEIELPVHRTGICAGTFLDDLYYLVEAKSASDNLDDSVKFEATEFPEGRVFERWHRAHERNSKVVLLAKQNRLNRDGRLDCDCCGFNFSQTYGAVGEGFIEAHHTFPVSEMEDEHITKVDDLALVCANCHRMLHRRRPWLNPADLRTLLIREALNNC